MEKGPSTFLTQVKAMLNLHKGERHGFFLLMAILVVIVFVRVVYVQWFQFHFSEVDPKLVEEMRAWAARPDDRQATTSTKRDSLFPFDPNTMERAEWLALGLSERQVDGVERYLAKGGRFRVKRDVAKLYAVTPERYALWEDYILLPDSLPKRPWKERENEPKRSWQASTSVPKEGGERYERKVQRKLEVNTADTTALIDLPGIGPAFARGIVKYRDRLGGYRSMEQLAEVYVLRDKPDALVRLNELLVLDTLMVVRIPINTCEVEQLAAHPYAGWKVAKALMAYRGQHGPFRTVADIRGCALIDEAVFRKLAPYLRVE